ncbi:MAG: transglycosylase domain-containing protein [Actinomycetota bacterium]|nr:transglycosylase domain-containing protein [Actinomycetota bacterium]
MRTRRRRHSRGRPRNKALLALAVLMVCAGLAGLMGVGYVISIASSAPPLDQLKMADKGQVTTVYASGGERLGVIQAESLRIPAPAETLPKNLKDATVAIEDERFFEHDGLDYEGIARAAVKNAESGSTREGGSTITQQVVKNLYISDERTYERKIKEAKLAEELEDKRDKNWILNTYLNTVPYGTAGGQSAIGARAAARVYFNKQVQDLTLGEAALLAGLPQAPSSYSPFRNPQAAENRRNEVLRKMDELGMITTEEAETAIAQPVDEKYVAGSKFFTERREKYFFDYVKDELLKEYGARTVRQGGLKVYTTIDLSKQKAARQAINQNLQGVGPSSAIVTIDPKNGYILAMASSAAYGKSKFNLAAQGRRQPGSAFKVMTLMTALRRGVDPQRTTYVSRSPTVIPIEGQEDYKVNTYSRTGAGQLDLVRATLKSDNSVFIQLAMDLGPAEVKKTARDLGIRSKLGGYPAETLGGLTDGVSPLEMANAYATIVSGGYRNRPTAIKKIVFPDGTVEQGRKLPPRFRVKRTKAFEDGVTYKAVEILEKNISAPGTGARADVGCPAGGKTGTTDKNTDAWFVGFTPKLATAVWVGYPNDRKQMNGLFQGQNVDGGTYPAQIWGEYMRKAKGGYCGGFEKPKQAFQPAPFFGKYSKGGPNTGTNGLNGQPGTGPAPYTGGRGGGGTGYDPDLYEAPPQEAPEEDGPSGGESGGSDGGPGEGGEAEAGLGGGVAAPGE